jgi:hypothetical protein
VPKVGGRGTGGLNDPDREFREALSLVCVMKF